MMIYNNNISNIWMNRNIENKINVIRDNVKKCNQEIKYGFVPKIVKQTIKTESNYINLTPIHHSKIWNMMII